MVSQPITALPTPLPRVLAFALLLGVLIASPAQATDLPSAGVVTHGAAAISAAGNQMTIQQTTPTAIINWDAFNIGSGHAVNFAHATATDLTLNRVTGATRSQIDGALTANGRVFLLNPNGVVFGPSARVDVGGLLVTTQAITDDDFRNGRYQFSPGASSSMGPLLNQGTPGGAGRAGFCDPGGHGRRHQ